MGIGSSQRYMDRILRLNEFFVEGGKQNVSHVLLHITEPSTPQEMTKGYFFAVCEINNADTKYIAKLQELIDGAENDYYQVPDSEQKTSLELVLEKINQEALTLVSSGLALNCVIGAIRQPEIIFTYYGKPNILVFYKNQQGSYQIMDLATKQIEDEPSQLFSHIIQGKISSNDYMFIGTPHIGEYFSSDRLQKIITSRPAVQSAQHIEKVLSDLRNGFSFGGIIVHIDRADSGPIPIRRSPVIKGASSKSLQSIFNREKNTADTLSPSLFPRLNEQVKNLLNRKDEKAAEEDINEETKEYQPAEINATHISYRHGQTKNEEKNQGSFNEKIKKVFSIIVTGAILAAKGIWYLLVLLYTALYSLIRTIILLFFVATNYQNRRSYIIESWKKQWHSYKENIRQLPFITKALFISSLCIATVFVGSILTIRYQKEKSNQAKIFDETVRSIKAKEDAMESALIYKNDQAAMTELASAQELLKNLSCNSKDEKNTCDTLANEINAISGRIRKISEIQPEIIHDWNNTVKVDNIIKYDTKLIGFSTNTSTILIYDQLTKEEKTIPGSLSIPGFKKASVPKENDFVLFSYNQNEFAKFDPVSLTLSSVSVAFPNEQSVVDDFVVYNRRLYTLDAAHSQIYRHDSIKNGFDRGKDWIKDGTLIKGGQELTIDGDMFVLKNNGEFTKFTSGVNQPFSIIGLEPKIEQNASVWTYTDQNYLYITDPTNKRLVILAKNGQIKEQLISKQFINPTGLAIDAENKVAFVVDNNKLLKITLPQ